MSIRSHMKQVRYFLWVHAIAFQFHSFIRSYGALSDVHLSVCMWHSILTWMCQLLVILNINQWHLIIPFHRYWRTKQKAEFSCVPSFSLKAELSSTRNKIQARSVNFLFVFINIYMFLRASGIRKRNMELKMWNVCIHYVFCMYTDEHAQNVYCVCAERQK